MKKIKNIFIKTLLSSLILAISVGMVAGAENAQEWRSVFSQDFSRNIAESTINSYIPEPFSQFSAAVEDEALSVKSDSFTNITFNDISSTNVINGSKNNHGISILYPGSAITKMSPVMAGGYPFEYTGSGGDSSTGFFNFEGKNAAMLGTYLIRTGSGADGWATRTNSYFGLVDKKIYGESDNNFKISLDYYMTEPSSSSITKGLNVSYMTTSGGMTSKALPSADLVTGRWATWEFEVNNACFAKSIEWNAGHPFNLRIMMSGGVGAAAKATLDAEENYYANRNLDPSLKVYIGGVRITSLNDNAAKFDTNRKAIYYPFNADVFGDAKLTFDMTIPTEYPIGSTEYNSEKGAVRVGIADANKNDVATVEIENTGSGTVIYAISENESGEETKTQIYTGNILDDNLSYTFTLDWREKTYTVKIMNGTDEVVAESQSFRINNYSAVEGNCVATYLVSRHSTTGKETFNIIDNINLSVIDDPAYTMGEEDVLAIEEEQLISGIVTEDFEVPAEGSINQSAISWTSSDSSILEVAQTIDGVSIIPHRGEADEEVTLTAVAVLEGVQYVHVYNLTVKEHDDHKKVVEAKEALVIDVPSTYMVEEDFTLPIVGLHDAQISWQTDNVGALSVNNQTGYATVTRANDDVEVLLTASITVGSFTKEKEYSIIVTGLSSVLSEIGEITETPAGEGKINASVTLQTPVTGNLTFAAFAVNASGEIVSRGTDTKTVASRTTPVTFNVTNLDKPEGTEVKYYLWDENGVSLENTVPTEIKDLTADGKVRGVRLNWSASKDDNNAIKYYSIFRNDSDLPIANITDTTYLDTTVERGVNYEYRVVPVDANYLENISNTDDAKSDIDMYFLDFETGAASGIFEYKVSGSSLTKGEKVEKDGVVCGATPNGGWLTVRTDAACISGEDRNIVVRVTYFDADNYISIFYNRELPPNTADSGTYAMTTRSLQTTGKNTNTWKTETVYLTDAQFRDQAHSHGHFGISGSSSKPCYIRRIEMIQTELYE